MLSCRESRWAGQELSCACFSGSSSVRSSVRYSLVGFASGYHRRRQELGSMLVYVGPGFVAVGRGWAGSSAAVFQTPGGPGGCSCCAAQDSAIAWACKLLKSIADVYLVCCGSAFACTRGCGGPIRAVQAQQYRSTTVQQSQRSGGGAPGSSSELQSSSNSTSDQRVLHVLHRISSKAGPYGPVRRFRPHFFLVKVERQKQTSSRKHKDQNRVALHGAHQRSTGWLFQPFRLRQPSKHK